MIRVLIAASSAVARAGLESLLQSEPGIEVAGTVPLDSNLAAAVAQQHPDVVLLAPPSSGQAAREIRALTGGRTGPAIVLLPEDAPADSIASLVAAAAAGITVLQPGSAAALLASGAEQPEVPAALTAREIEVLRMIADGAGNKSIAWKLGISEHTVKYHVASIMAKLNAGSRTEAVTLGVRRGLILL